MTWNETLQNVLLVGGGGVAVKLLEFVWQVLNGVLGRRRSEIDKMAKELALAIAERDKQTLLRLKYREMIYALRAMLIRMGLDHKDLPPEPED